MAGGRPRKYNTSQELEEAGQLYFDSLLNEDGTYKRPPTMIGLALALDFEVRRSIYAYSKNGEISHTITGFKKQVELFWEERLNSNSPTGAIFWLKNNGQYADKQEITGADGSDLLPKEIVVKFI